MLFSFRKIFNPGTRISLLFLIIAWLSAPPLAFSVNGEATLDELLAEGLRNNPEILAAGFRTQAAGYRIPQAKALPDPMFMFGYQNEGFRKITIGEAENAMGMSSLTQQFLFPGKRGLKGEMATRDAESQAAMHEATKLRIGAQIKTLFYDLFFAYKNIDILKNRAELFGRMEDAAAGRYASGTGMQQEVVMAQTEKYMILEREEMQRQRIQALQGMLNTTVGREVNSPLGRPVQPLNAPFTATLDELVAMAYDHSPEVRSKKKMVGAAEAKVKMAKREYYPDFALGASYFPRTKGLPDMWNLTATVNLPIYFRNKQRQALAEADAGLSEAKRELTATELMVASNVRDSYSMLRAAERLMTLYNEGLIQKANQDVQLAFSGYVTGQVDALTVISRIKNLLDFDLLYWNQFSEREKAIARLHSFTAGPSGRDSGDRSTSETIQGGAR